MTDSRREARFALGLPFDEAVVVEGSIETAELLGDERFAAVAADLSRLDDEVLAEVSRTTAAVLTPQGRLLLCCDCEIGTVSAPLPGWEWAGLSEVGGIPCAELRRGSNVEPVPMLINAVCTTFARVRVAERRTEAAYRQAEADVERQAVRHGQQIRELTARLEKAAAEVDRVRREVQGMGAVRAVLRGSSAGRGALRAARTIRDAARRRKP